MYPENSSNARGRADVIVGIQWGDEGKGRVVDYYAQDYDVIARFGGGDNAGHSIVAGDKKLALRIVPSGVLRESAQLFIGGGTVVSLTGLHAELEMLAGCGIDISRIKISDRAHVVLPYHGAQDLASEAARGDAAIGTTGRGIGPAYEDKVARRGLRFCDLGDGEAVESIIRGNLRRLGATAIDSPDEQTIVEETLSQAAIILPHVVDGFSYMHDALSTGRRVLIEGAQGSLLDVGYGTYPYVTSSHTIAGGACIGLGIGPGAIRRVVGVVKAYTTRVGAGPFPSELRGAEGERLRSNGNEFGTVTGRPRRCGWFDAVAARYAAQLNGLTSAVVTKLDVLSGFERIGIVTRYRIGDRETGFTSAGDERLETDVEYVPGWTEDLAHVRSIDALPKAAQSYLRRIEAFVGAPIAHVSFGPERSQLASYAAPDET